MAMRSAAGWAALVLTAAGLAACGTMRDRLVQSDPLCETTPYEIYFEADSAELSDTARTMLAEAARVSRGCRVERVEVVGLADAPGAPQVNLELSARRAQAVAQALAAAGLPQAEFRLAAAGEAGAVAADGARLPLRRRADVILHLAPPAP